MAMIKCPKCHHHISSMAQTCPECGATINTEEARGEVCQEVEADSTSSVEAADEKKLTAPRREDKRGGGKWIYIILAILLGLLIGGLYFMDYRAEQRREQRAYELLQDCSNPDFYEDFIIRFPNSQYIDDVRQRYQEVAQLQGQWQTLIEKGSREELQRFVREHPSSPYVKVAQGRIDSLDWAEAKQQRSLESIGRYMMNHPEGYYIDQAEMLRQTLERQREEAAALAAAERDSLAAADSAMVR